MGYEYVMSDLHNDYLGFARMLKKIRFGEEDRLYIVGDIFDRGAYPMQLYEAVRGRSNIYPVMGNHDRWLADSIHRYLRGEKGGCSYYNSFELLKNCMTREQLRETAEWIEQFPLFLSVTTEGEAYMLSHARTTAVPQEKDPYFFLMENVDFRYLQNGILDYISVIGHVPTDRIRSWVGDEPEWKNTVWVNRLQNVYCIDCGDGFFNRTSRLGCLRLNDKACFYTSCG